MSQFKRNRSKFIYCLTYAVTEQVIILLCLLPENSMLHVSLILAKRDKDKNTFYYKINTHFRFRQYGELDNLKAPDAR